MKRVNATKRVAHTAEQMFDLVADVERYPEFLPLCRSLTLRSREPSPEGETLTADMTVAYGVVQETFTSRVVLDRKNLNILVEYLDGPFTHMENRWSFADVAPGVCNIAFDIEYEFRSMALQMLMGGLFDQVFSRFSDAFVARADHIYGQTSADTHPA